MYPTLFTIFGKDVPTYGICIMVGIILCILTLYFLIKKNDMPVSVFDTYLTAGLVAICIGFFFALLYQSVYNCQQTGRFEWGGMTFMGGLIGGVVVFVAYLFLFIKNKKTKQAFWDIADFAVPCIFIAHAFGRIGCYFAGCCYGAVTENEFWGVVFPMDAATGTLRYPTQIFEAAFLFVMFVITALIALNRKKRGYLLSVYLLSYGVWRFFIEYLRGDNRGGVVGAALSPSQIQSIVFVVVGIIYLVGVYLLTKKGFIQEKMDWKDELKKEAIEREAKIQARAELKAQKEQNLSYEEYAENIENAEKQASEQNADKGASSTDE